MQLRRKCFRYANSKLVDLAVLERNNRTITTVDVYVKVMLALKKNPDDTLLLHGNLAREREWHCKIVLYLCKPCSFYNVEYE